MVPFRMLSSYTLCFYNQMSFFSKHFKIIQLFGYCSHSLSQNLQVFICLPYQVVEHFLVLQDYRHFTYNYIEFQVIVSKTYRDTLIAKKLTKFHLGNSFYSSKVILYTTSTQLKQTKILVIWYCEQKLESFYFLYKFFSPMPPIVLVTVNPSDPSIALLTLQQIPDYINTEK